MNKISTAPSQNVSPVAQIARSASKKFKEDFLELSRLIFLSGEARNGLHHAGEFGRYREQLLRSFITSFLPNRLAVGDGFVVTMLGDRSTQCDAIFYDRDTTPHLSAVGGLAMFPIEVCAAVGEVKSKLSFLQLKEALAKLRVTKKMRADMHVFLPPTAPVEEVVSARAEMSKLVAEGYSAIEATAAIYKPALKERQSLVTFIVCEEIEWPSECDSNNPNSYAFREALSELSGGPQEAYLRHNFILSLKQGFLSYYFSFKDEGDEEIRRIPYSYPVQTVKKINGADDGKPTDCGWRWLAAHDDHRHILMFVSELVNAASLVPIFPFTPQAHISDPQAYDFTFICGA